MIQATHSNKHWAKQTIPSLLLPQPLGVPASSRPDTTTCIYLGWKGRKARRVGIYHIHPPTHLPTYPPKPLSSLWEYSFTYPLPRLSSVPHWFSYKLPKAIFKVFNNNFKNDSNACFISVLKRLVNWKDLEQVAVSLVVSQALDRRRLTHGAMKRQNWPKAAAWPAAGMKDADWP